MFYTRSDADRAAVSGHIHILKWITSLEQGKVYCSKDIVDIVANNGHLHINKMALII